MSALYKNFAKSKNNFSDFCAFLICIQIKNAQKSLKLFFDFAKFLYNADIFAKTFLILYNEYDIKNNI